MTLHFKQEFSEVSSINIWAMGGGIPFPSKAFPSEETKHLKALLIECVWFVQRTREAKKIKSQRERGRVE